MKSLNKLQAEYYKRFPEEFKIEKGFEVLYEEVVYTVIGQNLNDEQMFVVDEREEYTKNIPYLKGFFTSMYASDDCTFLGKPLTLAMILRMLPEYIGILGDGTVQTFVQESGDWYPDFKLDLSLDPKDYPEETLLEICNLLDI